ncbi:MAG: hypothetical protein R6V85_01335, partial [Polyangia bacterium]
IFCNVVFESALPVDRMEIPAHRTAAIVFSDVVLEKYVLEYGLSPLKCRSMRIMQPRFETTDAS